MTFGEIKSLLDAGFSKDEIMALSQEQSVPVEKTQPEKPIELTETVPENDPVTLVADAPIPITNIDIPTSDPIFSQLNENINKLIKTIQSSNLRLNSVEKPTGADLDKTVDTIMESLIRPIKGGNEK